MVNRAVTKELWPKNLEFKFPQRPTVHSTNSTRGIDTELCKVALFTLGKTAILKITVFCVTIYTCQKNREVRAGTKDRDFLIGTAHAPHVGKGTELLPCSIPRRAQSKWIFFLSTVPRTDKDVAFSLPYYVLIL